MLGQLFGLFLKNCLVTDNKISFTTSRPLEARRFLDLSKQLLNLREAEFVYYLEDIEYGKDDSAADKFKLLIPDLLARNVYFFHRPENSTPKLTIIYYSEALPRILLSMLKHLPVLQQNTDFSKGLVDACLSNSSFSSDRCELLVPNSKVTSFLVNSLNVLGMYSESTVYGLLLMNFHDLVDIQFFADLCRGKLYALKAPIPQV